VDSSLAAGGGPAALRVRGETRDRTPKFLVITRMSVALCDSLVSCRRSLSLMASTGTQLGTATVWWRVGFDLSSLKVAVTGALLEAGNPNSSGDLRTEDSRASDVDW